MCHVLVIEDEPLIAEFVVSLAEEAGASSSAVADTVAAAIEAARRQLPDIILSDVNIRAGGRGPDAVAAIRRDLGEVPVVFITATPDDCTDCDYAMAVLEKPIQPHRVIAAIKQTERC